MAVALVSATGLAVLAAPVAPAASAATAWDSRIEPIAKKVEQLRGLDFEHPVPVAFLSSKAFDKTVTVDSEKLTKSAKSAYEKATSRLAALGLVPHDTDLVKSLNSLHSSSVLAYYDPEKKRVFVRGKDLSSAAARVTVAHELTHALQDQHFDLTALQKAATKTHSSDALRALVEGDAVRIQTDYVKQLTAAEQQQYDDTNRAEAKGAQDQATQASVPDSLQVLFEAPYDFGPSMLEVVIAGGDKSAVDKLFRTPPTNDLSYLSPASLLDGSHFERVAAPKADGSGERQVGKPDTFGAMALYLVLASRMDPADALAAVDGWGGDAMIDYQKSGDTCVRAAFVGRTTDATTAIADALDQWVVAQPAGSATVKRAGGKAVFSSCDVAGARPLPVNSATESVLVAANRDVLLGAIMKEGLPQVVALCTADGVIRDGTFAPVLQQEAQDPTAAPDPEALAALRTRVGEIARECVTNPADGSTA